MLLCISSHKLWLGERLPTKGAGLFCKPMYAGVHMASKQTSVHMNPLQLCPNSHMNDPPRSAAFLQNTTSLRTALADAPRAAPHEWWCSLFCAATKLATLLYQIPPDTSCAAQQGQQSANLSQKIQAHHQGKTTAS